MRACLWIWLLCLLCCACQQSLVQGLTERDANLIVLQLGEEGIVAEKQAERGGTFSVSVASDLVLSALAFLTENHLPRPQKPAQLVDALLPSPAQEQQQRLSEKVFSIEQMLAAVPRVLEVKLEVAAEPWPSKSLVRSVSVLYWYRGELPFQEDVLRRFVASSFGLEEPSKIAVLAVPQPRQAPHVEMTSVGPLGVSPLYESRLRWILYSLGFLVLSLLFGMTFLLLRQRKKPE